MYLEDQQFPYPHHPLQPDPDGDGLVADTAVEVEVFQLRPLTVQDCARWCGGTVLHINGGPALLLSAAGGVVGLGDYVVHRDGGHAGEPAATFAQRYRPVEPS